MKLAVSCCCFLLLFSFFASNVLGKSPVVIVPGTGGNQLEAKLVGKPSKPHWYCHSTTSSYFTLWLDIKALLPFAIDCWVDNIRLEWDMNTMTAKNSPGVLTRVSNFGETTSLETLDNMGLVKYMKPFIDHLTSLGYVRGKDIRGAPYDFRYAPDQLPDNFHSNLKTLVETTYTENGNKQVTLISHSYGCPVTFYFLSLQSQGWKSKYLKQWITLSGVFGGTKQQVQLYATGLLMGVPSAVVNPLKIRGEQRTSTSNLFMLPGENVWPSTDVIARTQKRSYSVFQIDDFLRDIGFPQGGIMRHHIINSTSLMTTNPGVPVHCFYGNIKESVVATLEYNGNFPDKPSNLVMGDGDGTVNLESLKLCERLVNRGSSEGRKGSVLVIPDANHNGVITDERMLSAIDLLLQ